MSAMVSLSYTDTRMRRSGKLLQRSSSFAGLFNWRLALALILNVALWTGVAKLLGQFAA
ncbi:MAG: hypothetical protein ACK4YQ_11330 [Phenylobacterium sp.]|uniref:hypothetical protein n=1 Tax=Phenylobacterium sp. TaxID=1871053 RepID=UPI00391D604F